jgi:two-component system CheB/CheR fusion protein
MMGNKKYLNAFENVLIDMAIHRVILDEQGKAVDSVFLEVNEAFAKNIGLKVADIVRSKITEVIPSIADTFVLESLGKVAHTGKPDRIEQYIELSKKYFIIDVYRIDKDTVVTILQDITEQKQAEEQTKTSELRYRTLFENANDTIFLMRGDKIIDCIQKQKKCLAIHAK